jgi:predicted dehydrogenase
LQPLASIAIESKSLKVINMPNHIKLGICGVGAFASKFIPLFKAHPFVRQLTLCDLDAAKLQDVAHRFGIDRTCPSLDALCQTDVDAIAIFSQNWLHGPHAVQAVRAGKHVYSAVPSAITMEEITALVQAVEQTGRIYMVGETSYYYPAAIYCRDRFRKGDFGDIVYGEGEYYHDFDHGLYDVMRWRGGGDWKKYAGCPPMHYPTHSMSFLVSVTGAHMTQVSCLGWVDRHEDGLFREGVNLWNNVFSNESALFRMSDGSMARINEFRRIGHPGGERINLYGTLCSYEEQGREGHQRLWVSKDRKVQIDLTDLLGCDNLGRKLAPIHPVARLPREFENLPNGHNGSHQFLVDDFVKACVSAEQPPNNVWKAARYLIPGLVAHESARLGGVVKEVPDLGSPS